MSEENKKAPKNKWSRIFRKKWFFPAVYLTMAAVLLAVVMWYQNMESEVPSADEEVQDEQLTNDLAPTPNDEEAQPVVDQQEMIQFPVSDQDQAEIVTKFYDYNASEEDQLEALVFYNNRYYQSTGIDVASTSEEEESFDVLASLSGTVTEVKEDPLLGNVVVLSHGNEVATYYASLGEVAVSAGDKVKQGDTLGTAGNNIFGKENGTHVHFELRKDGKEVNPENFFKQPVSALEEVAEEEVSEESKENEDAAVNEESAEEESTEESSKEGATEEEEEASDENAGQNGDSEDAPEDGESGDDATEDETEESSNNA
ncbi:M23 family metallopeptidase [Oceanobacillus senegalensis]|uniref:M23 family metallopeptidase n=1 Tax=Oceanobacillus senegalensis TaxID=1936063 RepID=UPI000A309D2A|nr:M23 family metallopeptidase [Oceanobacillus senegalensis]